MARSHAMQLRVILFAVLFVNFAYFHQREYRSLIPVSRLDLLHAIWVHGQFNIDPYHENTSNKAMQNGHYYSDKAPGTFVLALPAFSLAVGVLAFSGIDLDSDAGWLISSWITCAGSLGIITAFGGVALFAWLCRWVHASHACVTTLGVFLGAAPLPYSTLLMSHALVVGLLSIALWAAGWGLGKTRITDLPYQKLRDVLAGFCCGLALASEYSSGLVVLGILFGIVLSDFRRLSFLAVGIIPAVMLIPIYHWICFGNPVTFAYLHEASFTQMHEGFFGIKFPPKPEAAYMLLLSSQRGLFFWSPFLLIAFVGYSRLFPLAPNLYWITYLVPILHVAAIAAYFLPSAGGTLGPRLLSPILPMLALPTALGIARLPRIGRVLAAGSIAITLLATAVDVVSTVYYGNPLLELYWPALISGNFSPNLGTVLGLSRQISLLPLMIGLLFGMFVIWRGFRQHGADGAGRDAANKLAETTISC